MPQAPRPKGKAKKIAYKILGVPSNIKNQESSIPQVDNRQLQYEESYRSK